MKLSASGRNTVQVNLLSTKPNGQGLLSVELNRHGEHDVREEIMNMAFCCCGSKSRYLNTMKTNAMSGNGGTDLNIICRHGGSMKGRNGLRRH